MLTLTLVLSPSAHACSPPGPAPASCPSYRRATLVSHGRLFDGYSLAAGDPLIFHVTDTAWDDWRASLDTGGTPFTVTRAGDLALVWLEADAGVSVYVASAEILPFDETDGPMIGLDVVDALPADVEPPVWSSLPAHGESTHECLSGPVPALDLGATEPLALALVRAPGTGWSEVVAQWPVPPQPFEVLLEDPYVSCPNHRPTPADALEVTLFDLAGNVGEPVLLNAMEPPAADPADDPVPVGQASGCATAPLGGSALALALVGGLALRRRRR